VAAPALHAAQQLGAQVFTKATFGYGRTVFELDPSADAGIVNGFFLLKFQNGYPNGWTELDFEVVTGNSQNFRRTASGTCGDFSTEDGCNQGKLGSGTAANYVSVNIIGGPSNSGPASDSQVFYKIPSGYYNKVHTYSIENTPNNVRWTLDGLQSTPERIMYQDGTARPSPYPSTCTQYCDDVHTAQGFQYLQGREMNIYLNIYSGLGEGWGVPSRSCSGTSIRPI
jgi:beta-glucanase (GH16 family)